MAWSPRFARVRKTALALAASCAATASPLLAGAFRVAPINVEVRSGVSASALTIQNLSQQPMTIQLRVFRWRQAGGVESLEPSSDVIASPPLTSIAPGQSHVVRIVRLAGGEVTSEESYRLWADEVPDPRNSRPGEVNLLLRQSIPVFFESRSTTLSILRSAIERHGDALDLVVTNSGSRRERISDLRVVDSDGVQLDARAGLVGYVLAGSNIRWTLGVHANVKWPVTVTATSEHGPVHFVARSTGEQ